MDHKTCRDNLSAFLDGELPPEERAAVEAHLAGCPDCGAVLARLGAVSGLVKKHIMEPVPPALKKAVLGGASPALPWLKPVLALSTAAAGVLVVLSLNRAPDLAPALSRQVSQSSAPLAAKLYSPAASPAAETAASAGPSASAPMEMDKKAGPQYAPAVAAARGSYGQAKYASARASGALSAGSGAAGGGLPGPGTAPAPAQEFRGPVCVRVYSEDRRQEASGGEKKKERDEFLRRLDRALLFIARSGTPSPAAAPGRLVFVKKDGTRKLLEEKDCGAGFIFFDGVKDPLVVTDLSDLSGQYNKYFGTSPAPDGD